jgi:hypothetical protein
LVLSEGVYLTRRGTEVTQRVTEGVVGGLLRY